MHFATATAGVDIELDPLALRVVDPGLLDGVAVNAEVAEDLEQYDFLGIPAGVNLIDRPWSPG